MARRRRVSGLFRWLVCFGLPVGGLFALFSSGAHRSGPWPFGVGVAEVEAYASVFDVRKKPAERAVGDAWTISIGQHTGKKKRKKLSDADWRAAWFTAEDYRDTFEVRRLPDGSGGWELRFPKKHYFKEQRRLLLLPVNEHTEIVSDATAAAKDLGMHVPERTPVTVVVDGARAAFIAQECIDDVFLDKRGYADAVLFTQGFGSLHPEHWRPDADGDSALAEEIIFKQQAIMSGKGDLGTLVDLDATAAWLVMMEIEGRREDVLNEATFVLDRTTGRIAPLYTPRRAYAHWQQAGSPVPNMLRRLMNFEGFQERMTRMRAKLNEQRSFPAQLAATTEAATLDWLMASPAVAAQPTVADGPVAVAAVESLASIAERTGGTASGDTLRFVRGKHTIAANVTTPPNAVVILEKGTRWFLAAGVEVVVNGTLIMNGTGPNPVFIRPADDAPHGGITVNGADGSRCVINGLQMSGGAGKDGMLVFRNTHVSVEKSFLSGSGGTLIHVQRGIAVVKGCVFSKTQGDAIRLVNTDGSIEGSSFLGQGDGKQRAVVASAGKVQVTELRLSGWKDVGVFADAGAAVLVSRSVIADCGSGISAHDGAQVRVIQSELIDNRVGLHASRTQQHRKGGTFTLSGCTFKNNAVERQFDEASRAIEQAN